MNDAVVVSQLDKIIQLLSKRPDSGAEPQRKKVTDDGKEQLVDTKPKEPREIVKKAIPVRVESYSTEGKKFWSDLFSKASSTKTDKVVAEKKEDGGSFFGKLLKILGGIAIGAVLIKHLLPFIEKWKKDILKIWNCFLVPFFKGIWKSIGEKWSEWKKDILKIWNCSLVPFFEGIWKSIEKKWPKWKEGILKIWNCSLVPFFKGIWSWLNLKWTAEWQPALEEFWDKTFVPFFTKIWEKISPHIKDALLAGFTALLKMFFKLAWEAAKLSVNPATLLKAVAGVVVTGAGVVGDAMVGATGLYEMSDEEKKTAKETNRKLAELQLKRNNLLKSPPDTKTPLPFNHEVDVPLDEVDVPLDYRSDERVDLTPKKSLALQTTSVSQNAKIVELLATNNRLLEELNRNNLQKPGNTTIVNAPKTTSLSYNTSSPQSSFRQGIA